MKDKYDLEVEAALAEWDEHTRTHNAPAEHLTSIRQAKRAYQNNPGHDTAAEVVTLVRLFMEEPVP